jgi:hypothetical protein
MNDEKIKDPEVIADTFKTFFLTISENLYLHQEVRDSAISFLKEGFPRKFKTIQPLKQIKRIHSLKAINLSGYDGIASKFLKFTHL